jgi:nucleoside-diphosphate-sugar epimerase
MQRILVTGALGQIGTELVAALREKYGAQNVVASDVRVPPMDLLANAAPFEFVDVNNLDQLSEVVTRHKVDTIYHLAALLSATAEAKPQVAWELNMGSVFKVLEVARKHGCAVFVPSSIGAFGENTPKDHTPQDTLQRPSTMYGVTKVAGELLCDYYHLRFGVDTRGVRFPGLISYLAPPGGGTTDYAVDIFWQALRYQHYTCFLKPDTRLDMMYMPDALAAAIKVMEADPARLRHRNAFNVTAMNFTPEELAAAIRVFIPDFKIDYEIDPVKQKIADSWPNSLDDGAAREEWDWAPRYDLPAMVEDMLRNLRQRLKF